jgi:membrane-bound lytic murein transglycosylase D
MDLNGLRSCRIRAGRDLLIPVRVSGHGTVIFDKQIYRPGSFSQLSYAPKKRSYKVNKYRVRKGDSLWKIARRHNLRVVDIQRWNGMGRSTALKPGQVLKLKQKTRVAKKRSRIMKKTKKSGPKKKKVVTLRKGDNLWLISRRYQVSVADLERWNNIHSKTILQPGQRLVLFR